MYQGRGPYGSRARGARRGAWLLLAGLLMAMLSLPAGASGASTRGWAAVTGSVGWWDTDVRGPFRSCRMILAYNSGGMPLWTADRFRYYVTHVAPNGAPDGWLFDTVLMLALAADSQRGFEPGYGNGPSRGEDWRWYLDQRLFGGSSELAELERAVAVAGKELGDPRHVVRVVIAVPYPDPRATDFGALDDVPLDFSRTEDRAAAVRWYLRGVARRWTAGHFEHLRLGGFYWLREEVPDSDRALLKQVSRLVAGQLVPFYWIPYFGGSGWDQWRELGFDVAIQQPNYFFYQVPPERLKEAAHFAWDHRMGVEMELDRRVMESEERRSRYLSYLRAGVEQGYQEAGTLAWYDDSALLECARSQDPAARHLYDATYDFIRGVYPGG